MKSVFLVEVGERYEGSQIIGVYLSKENAVRAALECETSLPGGWKELAKDSYWTNGGDFLRVFEMRVQK
jgi:hypothetical protein